jgi:hypothetical protein
LTLAGALQQIFTTIFPILSVTDHERENVLNSKHVRIEEKSMETRQFGKTDMQVSVLGFGGVEIEGSS